jgi:hypothetical protein
MGQHGLASARPDRHCRAANLNFRFDHELRTQHKHVPKLKDLIGRAIRFNVYPNAVYIMRTVAPSALKQAQSNTAPSPACGS